LLGVHLDHRPAVELGLMAGLVAVGEVRVDGVRHVGRDVLGEGEGARQGARLRARALELAEAAEDRLDE
jgi:hypothetical protein